MKKSPVMWVGRSKGVNDERMSVFRKKPEKFSKDWYKNDIGFIDIRFKVAHELWNLSLRLGEIKPFRIKFVPVRRKK